MSVRFFLSKKQIAVFYLMVLTSSGQLHAAEKETAKSVSPQLLKEVVVTASKLGQGVASLPAVEGARIYTGKKTSYVDLQEAPPIVNNNYRQTFQKTPGLLWSQESTPLVSIGYRGLNPDRMQFMQVLKDGIPIVADMFGYPEAYYTPANQAVDHIEFVRGGSSLMYGPQPGGAINFITKSPDVYGDKPLSLSSESSFGSHGFFSEYSSISGHGQNMGYYAYAHHRQSQGFREFNGQYSVWYGGAKILIEPDATAKWTVSFDLYNEEHGEPGGLTRANFDGDPDRTTRLTDHFELNRNAGSLSYIKEVSEKTLLEWKTFGAFYERLSWRQRGGGFGTLPTGATASTNDIQSHWFYTGGTDLRLKHDYDALWSAENTLTTGVFYYHSTSPRTDERGLAADALEGFQRQDSDRQMEYLSLFFENLIHWGKWSVTPGLRLENIWQRIQENTNLDKAASSLNRQADYDFVPLFGIGASYEINSDLEVYSNFSQSYRPKLYTEAVPLGAGQVVNADLEEGNAWQTDLGLKGRVGNSFSFDLSLFYMEFDGQTGTAGNIIQNVGDAEYRGIEWATDWNFYSQKDAALSLFYNATVLDAEFAGGPNTGKIPQYAPDFNMKGGVEWKLGDRAKIRLSGTFLDDHFGDDSNLEQRAIPSYKVWDITGEFKIYKDSVTVFGGIQNMFDEKYFARVTGTGIDPADGVNYYGGIKAIW